MVEINKLAAALSKQGQTEDGLIFEVQPIPGDVEVLQISVEDRGELPIYISSADDEILCMSYLFKKDEIKEESISELNEAMLSMNVPMPLSAFATIGEQYVIFGSLSASSSTEAVIHEIELLSENTIEAIKALKDYLK